MLRRGQATVRPADLKRLRTEKFTSQAAFASATGYSEGLVSHAELGRRNLSLETVIRFADVLGCKPSDIADIHVTPEDLAATAKAIA